MVYKPIAKCWNFVNLQVWPTPSGRGGTNLCLSIGLAKPWGEACVGWSDTSEAREFTGEEGAQVEVVRELLLRIIFGSEIASYKSCTEVSWKLDQGWWLLHWLAAFAKEPARPKNENGPGKSSKSRRWAGCWNPTCVHGIYLSKVKHVMNIILICMILQESIEHIHIYI